MTKDNSQNPNPHIVTTFSNLQETFKFIISILEKNVAPLVMPFLSKEIANKLDEIIKSHEGNLQGLKNILAAEEEAKKNNATNPDAEHNQA